jgi:RNA polymerase-binding transcription factor DksA
MIAFERRDIESLQNTLLDRRTELLKEVRDVSGRDGEEPFRKLAGEVADSGDESVAATLIDTDHAAVGRDLDEIRSIDRALKRIADGSYGRCSECGTEIPYARLEVNPTAARCFPCQDHFEKTHRHDNWPLL